METFQAHNPSRWSVVVVLLVIFGLIGGIFFWAFYLNLGNVSVSADGMFAVVVADEVYECRPSCDIELPVGKYDFVAKREGYYPELFSKNIEIGDELEVVLDFRLIPFLKKITDADMKSIAEPNKYRLVNSAKGKDLIDVKSAKTVVSFESLKKPVLSGFGQLLTVVDQSRLFLVDVAQGRKRRLFDESLAVKDAVVSDAGERVLLHVEKDNEPFLWVWKNKSGELMPLTIYAEPEAVVWFPKMDYKILMLVDDVSVYRSTGLLDDLLLSAAEDQTVVGLVAYNLDTLKGEVLSEFSAAAPIRIFRLSDRVFLEYSAGEYQELVVRDNL